MIDYKYFPLIKPTVIDRRYRKDIQPPHLTKAENFLVSRSDDTLVIRPDFNVISEDLLARSDTMYLGPSDEIGDFLNSAVGIWGTDSLVFFSRYMPYSANSTGSTIKAGTYTTGTVDCTAGGKTLTENGAAGNTEWLTKVWPGCILKFDSDSKYYLIEDVSADDSLTITGSFQDSFANKDYTIYLTHSAFHSMYKVNVQTYSEGLIYNAPPDISRDVLARNIHGPLYAGVTEGTDETTEVNTDTSDSSFTWADANYAKRRLDQLDTVNGPWMVAEGGSKVRYASADPHLLASWTTQDMDDIVSEITVNYAGVERALSANPNQDIFFCITCRSADTDNFYGALMGNGYTRAGVTLNWGEFHYFTGPSAVANQGSFTVWIDQDLTIWSLPDGKIYTTAFGDVLAEIGGGSAPVWTEVKSGLGSTYAGNFILGDGYLVTGSSYDDIYYTVNGSSWTADDFGPNESVKDVAYNPQTDTWMFLNATGDKVYYSTGPPASWSWSSFSLSSANQSRIHYNSVSGITYICGPDDFYAYSMDGSNWVEVDITGLTGYSANTLYSGAAFVGSKTYLIGGDNTAGEMVQTQIIHETKTTYAVDTFAPVSDDYRASTFSVLEGYVVLMGTREHDAGTWTYYPRRIRWTAPFTVTDFTSTGSGTADLTGHGAIMDSRPVNGRIVTFETSGIGAISPRNTVDDPWDYEKIYDSLYNLSNPVVVEEVCFFVAQDGLLYQTDGVAVQETESSFDISKHTDWDETTPIWLTYSKLLNSLIAYSPNALDNTAHVINLNNGGVTSLKLFSATTANLKLRAITSSEESADRRLFLCYGAHPDDTDTLVTLQLSQGERVTGVDEPNTTAADDNYWHAVFDTGEINLSQEGEKVVLPHVILETYTDARSGTNSDRPDVILQVRSNEDEAWHRRGTTKGTITITDAACTGSGTAFSNRIGRAGTEVDGATGTFTLPCQADRARVYLVDETSGVATLQTAYTTSGNDVIFTSDPAATNHVDAYWDSYPEVVVEVSDYIYAPKSDSWHRITAINTATNLTLDHYLDVGSDDTAVHHHAEQMPDGEGQVKLGIHKLMDRVQARVVVVARSGGNESTTAKVSGISFGTRPHGKRLVEATGE